MDLVSLDSLGFGRILRLALLALQEQYHFLDFLDLILGEWDIAHRGHLVASFNLALKWGYRR